MEAVAVWVVLGLLCAVQAALGFLVFQLVKQQGRLLLRVEELERHPVETVPAPGELQALPSGLPVGTPVAPFRLPSPAGDTIALEQFRGRRVLLVHWSPACGYCSQIAPDLAELEPKLRARNVDLLLVSSGGAQENRRLVNEFDLRAHVVLQDAEQPLEVFQGLGTRCDFSATRVEPAAAGRGPRSSPRRPTRTSYSIRIRAMF